AISLFRGHISSRADHRSGHGAPRRFNLAHQTEIHYIGPPAGFITPLDHDIGRLDIAMNKTQSMRGMDRLGHALHHFQLLRQRHLLGRYLERTALYILHGNIRLALYFADFIYLTDIIVPDARLSLRFLKKAGYQIRIVAANKFQRDITP